MLGSVATASLPGTQSGSTHKIVKMDTSARISNGRWVTEDDEAQYDWLEKLRAPLIYEEE